MTEVVTWFWPSEKAIERRMVREYRTSKPLPEDMDSSMDDVIRACAREIRILKQLAKSWSLEEAASLLPCFENRRGVTGAALFYAMPPPLRLADLAAPLSVPEALAYARQLYDAVAYLRAHALAHLNMRAETVHVERSTWRLVVADYSMAMILDEGLESKYTTPWLQASPYLPTDTLIFGCDKGLDHVAGNVDPFSIAMLLYFMLTHRLDEPDVWYDARDLVHYRKANRNTRNWTPSVPPDIATLVDQCLMDHRKQRPRFGVAREHLNALCKQYAV